MTEIVACYVVCNEEDHIADSIRSIKSYVDRFVVVDSVFISNPLGDFGATHSTDGTRAVIEAACAAPPFKPLTYIESAAKLTEVQARNTYLEAIELPDWAFVIDGDEVLYGDHARALALFDAIRSNVILGHLAMPVFTTAINANKSALEIGAEEFAFGPVISTMGHMPRLIAVSQDLRYTLPVGAITPALTYAGPPEQYLTDDLQCGPDEMFLINHHIRQSLESYHNDYVWETEGINHG